MTVCRLTVLSQLTLGAKDLRRVIGVALPEMETTVVTTVVSERGLAV
jgi:hypothetical protein